MSSAAVEPRYTAAEWAAYHRDPTKSARSAAGTNPLHTRGFWPSEESSPDFVTPAEAVIVTRPGRARTANAILGVLAVVLLFLSLAINVPTAGSALSEGEPKAGLTSQSRQPLSAELASPSLSAHYAKVRRIICVTFGPECQKAQRVAWCESRFNVYAVGNRYGRDPYYGLFQFGAYARRTYGFAWDARTQARAAKRMRDREGWRPWPVCSRVAGLR